MIAEADFATRRKVRLHPLRTMAPSKAGPRESGGRSRGREAVVFGTYRLYDLRHAFAAASIIGDPTCIYRLSEHIGQPLVSMTESYCGHVKNDGAMWRYSRDLSLFERERLQ
jgi:hypothetical protein